jgi:hypothetical protein
VSKSNIITCFGLKFILENNVSRLVKVNSVCTQEIQLGKVTIYICSLYHRHRIRYAASLTPRLLYPWGKELLYLLVKRLGGA